MPRSTIGARRRLFIIETPLDAPDHFGGFVRSFQPGPLVWGALEPIASDERREGGRMEEAATHRVRIRPRAPFAPGSRLALGPRRFRIRSTRESDGTGREFVCLVEEIKP
ncbi:MAG: head-tail adaptor protein [Microvirga sp.]|nr:head-tail adaptor protein [Microvirga sp.]